MPQKWISPHFRLQDKEKNFSPELINVKRLTCGGDKIRITNSNRIHDEN